MLLHVLTFMNPSNPSQVQQKDIDLLASAAEQRGHQLEVIYARDCQLEFLKKPHLLIKNTRPEEVNVVLVKANFFDSELHGGVIKQFDLEGVEAINKYLPVILAKNKVRQIQTLSKYKIPIPKTYVVRSSEYISDVVKNIGHFPVILKTLAGSHGVGVSIVESQRGLRSIIEMLIQTESAAPVIVQEYVKESAGKDIRVFIIDKKFVAAMERVATQKGEFRSNFELGGRVRIAELSKKEKEVALSAAQALGLEIAGVDLLRTKNGPKILEVNCNPGLSGITEATNRDIAGKVIDYMVKVAKKQLRKKKK